MLWSHSYYVVYAVELLQLEFPQEVLQYTCLAYIACKLAFLVCAHAVSLV